MLTAIITPRRALLGLVSALAVLAPGLLHAQPASADPLHAGAVYTISNAAAGNEVVAFHRDHTGALTPAGAFATGGLGNGGSLGSQGALALSDDGQSLVAVNAGSDTLSLFRVRPGGLELLDIDGAQGVFPVSVTIERDLVYVVNDGTDNIAGFRIESGKLEPIPGSSQSFGAGAPGQVSFANNGKTLVVTNKTANQIAGFPVDSHGVAGPATVAPSAAPVPFGFAVDRNGRAIVSEAPGSNLSSYSVDREGTISLIDGPVPDGQAAACWVVLSKDERFAFTANAGNATISTYRVAKDGTLTLLVAVAGNTVGGPQDLAVSNDGHYLYAVSRATHTISEFAINADGSLEFLGSVWDLAMGSASGLVAK